MNQQYQMSEPYIATTLPEGLLSFEMPDGTFAHAADPTVPFELRRDQALQAARAARELTRSLHTELREHLLGVNALAVYTMVVLTERRSRLLVPADAYGYDAAVDYLGGVVLSLPRDAVATTLSLPVTRDQVSRADHLLRQIAAAEATAVTADVADHPDQRNADARFLLLHERQFDRMAGYYPHLRTITDRVFVSVDPPARSQLGYGPTDAIALAEVHARWQERQLAAVLEATVSNFERFVHGVLTMMVVDPARAAEAVGLTQDVVVALLGALSTELGSLEVDAMAAPNRLRRFPVVALPDGRYLWARPYDFLHESLDWFDELLVEGGRDGLRSRLTKGRTTATETLTSEVFARVFGATRTHVNIEYQISARNWAEVDTVVDVPKVDIVVEAKGHRLTDLGRSGDPARVRTKFEQLITEPLRQSARARASLLEGAACREKRTGRPVQLERPETVLRCVVMLERVDPFVSSEPDSTRDSNPEDDRYVWIVCLADLLMVADILTTPAEFIAYIRSRCEQTALGSPRIICESDALGAWLRSREGAWPVPRDSVVFLEASSDAINAYFTQVEMHSRYPDLVEQPHSPTSHIPPAVLRSLSRLLEAGEPEWAAIAEAACAVVPPAWQVVDRDLARLSTTPRSRSQRRALAAAERGRRLSEDLTVRPGAIDSVARDEDGFVLTVAR